MSTVETPTPCPNRCSWSESEGQRAKLLHSPLAAARVASIHGSYHGQKATSGNFAFGFGATTEIPLRPCPEFCLYPLMDLQRGEEVSLFRIASQKMCASLEVNSHQVVAAHLSGVDIPERVEVRRTSSVPHKASISASCVVVENPRTMYDVAKC